jgi:hypothetical protein
VNLYCLKNFESHVILTVIIQRNKPWSFTAWEEQIEVSDNKVLVNCSYIWERKQHEDKQNCMMKRLIIHMH